jgi:hypothetical protein
VDGRHLILERKSHDPLAEVGSGRAEVGRAVNTEGSNGNWDFAIAYSPNDVPKLLDEAAMMSPRD